MGSSFLEATLPREELGRVGQVGLVGWGGGFVYADTC